MEMCDCHTDCFFVVVVVFLIGLRRFMHAITTNSTAGATSLLRINKSLHSGTDTTDKSGVMKDRLQQLLNMAMDKVDL